MTRLLRIDGMLSRTEGIDGFHLKLSRTEKKLYEEFLRTEEAEILAEMQQYFAEAKQRAGGHVALALERLNCRIRSEGVSRAISQGLLGIKN
jgi:hypothetical protein